MFGALLDSTCLTWQNGDDTSGSCWIYDRKSLSWRLIVWWLCLKAGGLLMYSLALRVYRPPTSQSVKVELRKNKENDGLGKTFA